MPVSDYYSSGNYWLISSGCDWLTGTTTYPDDVKFLEHESSMIGAQEMKRGCAESLWYFEGFKGWNCGSIAFGYSNDRAIIRLSSHVAKEHSAKMVSHLENISRFDLQATYRFKHFPSTYAEDIEDMLLAGKEKRKSKLQVELKRNSNKGNTVYAGSRKSVKFHRAYHKGMESGLEYYHNCLRFETQFNKKLANVVARMKIDQGDGDLRSSAILHAEWTRLGIIYPLDVTGREVEHNPRPKSTVEKQLRWLSTQVKPVVKRLISQGYEEQVLKALEVVADSYDPGQSEDRIH